MKRHWAINREHIQHLIANRFQGSLSAFVHHCRIDKNTLRRWLTRPAANSYSSTVQQLSRAFHMPAAAFAFQLGDCIVPAPEWLAATRDLLGDDMAHISYGTVMPSDEHHPFVRSWSFQAPAQPCWGVIQLHYTTRDCDFELFGMRTVRGADLAVRLGHLSVRGNQYDLESSWPSTQGTGAIDAEGGQLSLAVLYNDWPEGFLVRANAPFSVQEAERICQAELSRRSQASPARLLSLEPLTGQTKPRSCHAGCPHCLAPPPSQPYKNPNLCTAPAATISCLPC